MNDSIFTKMKIKIQGFFLKRLKKLPSVQKKIQSEYDEVMKEIEKSLKPYKNTFDTYSTIPQKGIEKNKILNDMKKMYQKEEAKWKDGYVSGAVYHGNKAHIDFLNKVYAINSQTNPLHADIWPSGNKFEAEIVAMTSSMMNAASTTKEDSVCGTVTSGGSESIMLAMKTYRDWARDKKGIQKPEMIVPVTVHAAFDKASQYFKIKMRKIPLDKNFKADIKLVEKAINKNTVVIVGSAPAFPHGIIDPIEEMSQIALKHKIGFHTDACLGGFILPWAEKLGYDIPTFDFRLKGVTSISADTHKYGYAAKGTSVIMYRNQELRHYQFYKTTEWPGGLYFSPTFAGSRPGALSAQTWASMLSIGEKGYLSAAKKILETANKLKKGITSIPELKILGEPVFNIAFASDEINIYNVLDRMTNHKWSLNGLHKPSSVHICVTLRHTEKGVAEKFIKDLKTAVKYVKANPDDKGDMAPVYGMAATMPDREIVADMLDLYMDLMYKV